MYAMIDFAVERKKVKYISSGYRRFWLGILLLFVAQFYWAPTLFAVDIPQYTGYVNDYAGLLSPALRTKLEKKLGKDAKL